jgi:hypothetical protein
LNLKTTKYLQIKCVHRICICNWWFIQENFCSLSLPILLFIPVSTIFWYDIHKWWHAKSVHFLILSFSFVRQITSRPLARTALEVNYILKCVCVCVCVCVWGGGVDAKTGLAAFPTELKHQQVVQLGALTISFVVLFYSCPCL